MENNMEKLLALLAECRPDIDFETEKNLIDDGLLESLDIVMIVEELSDAFDVEISVDDLVPENFNSAEAMLSLIEKLGGEE